MEGHLSQENRFITTMDEGLTHTCLQSKYFCFENLLHYSYGFTLDETN